MLRYLNEPSIWTRTETEIFLDKFFYSLENAEYSSESRSVSGTCYRRTRIARLERASKHGGRVRTDPTRTLSSDFRPNCSGADLANPRTRIHEALARAYTHTTHAHTYTYMCIHIHTDTSTENSACTQFTIPGHPPWRHDRLVEFSGARARARLQFRAHAPSVPRISSRWSPLSRAHVRA